MHGRMTPDGPGATPAYAGGHGAFKWAEVPVGGPGRAWANDARWPGGNSGIRRGARRVQVGGGASGRSGACMGE